MLTLFPHVEPFTEAQAVIAGELHRMTRPFGFRLATAAALPSPSS